MEKSVTTSFLNSIELIRVLKSTYSVYKSRLYGYVFIIWFEVGQ